MNQCNLRTYANQQTLIEEVDSDQHANLVHELISDSSSKRYHTRSVGGRQELQCCIDTNASDGGAGSVFFKNNSKDATVKLKFEALE